MNLQEFKEKTPPGGRGSRLDPHRHAMFELREAGYTIGQIRAYVTAQGVVVSGEAIRQYLARHYKKGVPQAHQAQKPTNETDGQQAVEKPNRFGKRPKQPKFSHDPSATGIFEKLNGEA